MPHIRGPKYPNGLVPSRPFSVNVRNEVTLFGNMFSELKIHTIKVTTPASWGDPTPVDHFYVKIRASCGTVEAKRKSFAEAFLAVIAALEALQALGGDKEESS